MSKFSFSSKILLICVSILPLIYSLNLLFVNHNTPQIYALEKIPINSQAAGEIPDFWNLTEIQSIPLNITYDTIDYHWESTYQKNLTISYLHYTSQYWINNTPLRIEGALIFPDNSTGQLGKTPGILVMHGIGGNYMQLFGQAYFLAAHNYTALIISHPGHGGSDGPPPTHEWIIPDLTDYNGTITPDILNRTHFYLIARSAVRGIDVLLNQSVVDSTKIAMTGGSYGGLTTMFASNIYWQKVRSSIPIIASGNLDISFSTPYSLTNIVVNPHQVNLNQPPLSDLFNLFDPINYVNTTHNPATLYICGTNDDFFPLETFNNTYYATYNTTKAMSMSPGGHHGLLMEPWEGTILYWLNHTLFDGPAPPKIEVTRNVQTTFTGKKLSITANITCNAPISRVILATHWEVLGGVWKEREMTQLNQSMWTFDVRNLPYTADLSYFVIVEIDGQLYTAFSSYVWRDTLTTWLTIPFFILIGAVVAVPIYFLMRRDINKMRPQIEEGKQRKYLLLNITQLGGMGATESFLFACLFFPILIVLPQTSHMEISLAIVFNEFVDFVPRLWPLVLAIMIAGFVLAMSKPILGGTINLIIPMLLFIVGLMFYPLIGGVQDNELLNSLGSLFSIGFGLILWYILGGIQIGFGIFKRKYQKRLITKKN